MIHLFVPFKESQELRNLGFRTLTLGYYNTSEEGVVRLIVPEAGHDFTKHQNLFGGMNAYNNERYFAEGTIAAPTWDQAFEFFMNHFNLMGEIRWWEGFHPLTKKMKMGELKRKEHPAWATHFEAKQELLRLLIKEAKAQTL